MSGGPCRGANRRDRTEKPGASRGRALELPGLPVARSGEEGPRLTDARKVPGFPPLSDGIKDSLVELLSQHPLPRIELRRRVNGPKHRLRITECFAPQFLYPVGLHQGVLFLSLLQPQ